MSKCLTGHNDVLPGRQVVFTELLVQPCTPGSMALNMMKPGEDPSIKRTSDRVTAGYNR